MMKMKILNIVCTLFVSVATGSLMSSCSEDEMDFNLGKNEGVEISLKNGVPMVMNVSFEGDDAITRSEDYVWPDDATIVMQCSSNNNLASTGAYMCAIYSASTDSWTLYNFNQKEVYNVELYQVHYSEGLFSDMTEKIAELDSWLLYSDATKPGYVDRLIINGKWDGVASTCSYKDGVFYLNCMLQPLYGRVRFVSDTMPDSDFYCSHSRNCCNGDVKYNLTGYNNSGAPTSFMSLLEFSQESDGRYYSQYIHARAVPEVELYGGDSAKSYVYRYKGFREIPRGKSGCIELPSSIETSDTWQCEELVNVLSSEEISFHFSDNQTLYIDLIGMKAYTDLNEYKANSNTFDSSVGVYAEVSYNVEFTGLSIYGSVYLIVDNGSFSKSKNYFEGNCWLYKSHNSLASSGTIRGHCCEHVVSSVGYYPYLELVGGSNCSGTLTIRRSKISNF